MKNVIKAADSMLHLMRKLYSKQFISDQMKQEMTRTCQYYNAMLKQYREQQQAKAPKQASLL